MSMDGAISIVWGDGEQAFRLGIGQFRELQEKVNLRRLAIGAPIVGPMLGLVGGGKTPAEAHRLLMHYFDAVPPLENMRPAFVVLMAGLAGAPGDDAKKKRPRKPRATSMRRSTSPPSTDPAQP